MAGSVNKNTPAPNMSAFQITSSANNAIRDSSGLTTEYGINSAIDEQNEGHVLMIHALAN